MTAEIIFGLSIVLNLVLLAVLVSKRDDIQPRTVWDAPEFIEPEEKK